MIEPTTPTPPLRVVHVASGREWRGGQRQVLLLAQGLLAAPGIESVVLTGEDSQLAARCRRAGVTVHGVTWSMGLDPRVVHGLLGEIGPGTILHAHDQHAHTLADAASRIRGGHVVVTRRVEFPIRHPARWRRTTHAIALSRAVEARLKSIGLPDDRITVIPPGVELASAAVDQGWPDGVPSPPAGAPFILCIAALTPEKGLDVLFDAAARLRADCPTLTWIVLGEGKDRKALERQRADLGLEEIVSLPGHIEHPELVLARATLLVQPSRSEGFGSSVLDALALGIPVVASDAGGLPDSLAGGGGLLVPAGDAIALADAVQALILDPARRERLSGDGRIAAEAFSIPRLVSRTVEVYRSAAMTTLPR
ncbi:MAG TPA: glycosyltransferase family 4 protein [Gemmatimonadales bacterium]|nr:glycosyltransferase family 4 protein [Gemmatimonadales bacterium]